MTFEKAISAPSADPPLRNNATKTRGRPFQAGNPGRPKGSRNKTTLAVEALLEDQHVRLTERAIAKALEGDVTALKLCLDRIAPLRRDAPIRLDLPRVLNASDILKASSAIVAAVSNGEITPSEAGTMMTLLSAHHRFIETLDIEVRLEKIEKDAESRR